MATLPTDQAMERWRDWAEKPGETNKEIEINLSVRRGGPQGSLSNYYKLSYSDAQSLIPATISPGHALFVQLGLGLNSHPTKPKEIIKPYLSYAKKNPPFHSDRFDSCFELYPQTHIPAPGSMAGNLKKSYFRCMRRGWKGLGPTKFNFHDAFNYPNPRGSTPLKRVHFFIIDNQNTLELISKAVYSNHDLYLAMGYWAGNGPKKCVSDPNDLNSQQYDQLNEYVDVFKPVLMAAPEGAQRVPISQEDQLLRGQELFRDIKDLKNNSDGLSEKDRQNLDSLTKEYEKLDGIVREIVEELDSKEASIVEKLGDIRKEDDNFLDTLFMALSQYPTAFFLDALYDLAHPCPQECDR